MKSKLVHECLEILQKLALNNDLTIMWIARKGSEEKFIGPEPFCGYQICHFKERLKKWEKEEKEKYWESLSERSQTRI